MVLCLTLTRTDFGIFGNAFVSSLKLPVMHVQDARKVGNHMSVLSEKTSFNFAGSLLGSVTNGA